LRSVGARSYGENSAQTHENLIGLYIEQRLSEGDVLQNEIHSFTIRKGSELRNKFVYELAHWCLAKIVAITIVLQDRNLFLNTFQLDATERVDSRNTFDGQSLERLIFRSKNITMVISRKIEVTLEDSRKIFKNHTTLGRRTSVFLSGQCKAYPEFNYIEQKLRCTCHQILYRREFVRYDINIHIFGHHFEFRGIIIRWIYVDHHDNVSIQLGE
jgi:hypothetical protein